MKILLYNQGENKIFERPSDDKAIRIRNMLRDSEIDDIEDNKKNYQTSVYYIDIINELEKMGDFMINVSQELDRSFIK